MSKPARQERGDDAATETPVAAPREQAGLTAPPPANSNPAGSPKPTADLDDEPGFLRRTGGVIAAGLLLTVVAGGIAFLVANRDTTPGPKRVPETIVQLLPPPPPPPPPQPEQPKPEPELIEQPKMVEPEIKEEKPVETPKEAPPEDAADEPPPGPLGLDATAEGPGDAFNLAGRPGGRGLGLGGGGGGGGGSKWGWYASMAQQQVEAALRRNARTRTAKMQVNVRIWLDGSGRITRVVLASSTGDAGLDAALRNEGLPGVVMREPPPKDMPMPIVMRITGRRPT